MSCYRPIDAWAPLDGGQIVFKEVKDARSIKIKCGRCIGCKLERRDAWAVRCFAESQTNLDNCFLTLTYDESHLPMHGSLVYRDFQLFMKRLRKYIAHEHGDKPIKFFMCGEYGDDFDRPHFHALLFGFNFPDFVRLHSGSGLARSESLERLWKHGFSTVGEVTYASCRYVASYCIKKVVGKEADEHYKRVDPYTGEIVAIEPEFCRASQGLGLEWLRRYWKDVYLRGHHGVVLNGSVKKVPRYFDKKLDEIIPLLMDDVEFQRQLHAGRFSGDQTPERLAARERVEHARIRAEADKRTAR